MSKVIETCVVSVIAIASFCGTQYMTHRHVIRVTPLQHLKMPTVDNVKLSVKDACPDGMTHVVGDYCPELVQTCIRERKRDPHVKNPGKTPIVCEEFAKTSTCLSKKTVHMDFCMDTLEHTEETSDLPRVYVSWWDARNICEIEGKRLCKSDEWTKACEGADLLGKPIGYGDGYTRDKSICNIDRPWKNILTTPFSKVDKRVPVGSMKECKNEYGIFDMNSNVDEFVENEHGSYHHEPWVSTLRGGHAYGVRNTCRAMTTSHSPDFAYYAEGFRCCKDIPN